MKKLSYLMLSLLSVITYGCAEIEQPYVGYIVIERAVVEANGSSTTITADTDISSPIIMEVVDDGADWCTVTANGKEITATATKPNTAATYRTATIKVRCGYRETSFTVLQKYEGQQYLQYDWTKWSATGSDVQSGDGGGYPSLFTENRGEFWHSQYSPATPAPHWLIIDMKAELTCYKFDIGRRLAGANNYPSVKMMEIYASNDNQDFSKKVGGFTFALPWTAPDGTVVNGNSPLVPGYEEVLLAEPVKARYIKLLITETNNTTGVAQVSYFKAYEKI